ncbi:hypothetical protein CWN80_09185 [Janibacter hoylei PVAS-1]|uniref:WXG100 family type VII secretion target n=2 Tax=Janibacter TaxID=53457 RepID=A0A444B3I9_9MICO|nr:hypothetical protein [Janibacter hoylei]RWU82974.1 hypothetical protein CWN80_09185 [Janibacter hoylei PVAS-1]
MAGVTSGADPDRLDEISELMRGHAEQIGQLSETLGHASTVLRASWSGPDMEYLLAQTDHLRPEMARTGSTLVAFADQLRHQADEQRRGSGEGGGAGRPGARDGEGIRGGRHITGVPQGFRDLVGGMTSGEGRSPFDLPAGAMTNAIGDGPQTDPGEVEQPGYVSNSDDVEGGKVIKGQVTGTETVAVSREFVDSEGRSVQTTTVSVRAEAGIAGEAGGDLTGGGFSASGGKEASYEVTAPVGVDPLSIDPNDPMSWPPGVSVRFSEEYFAAFDAEARFRGLMAGAGYEFGTEGYVEISRGDGDQVVVQVGDAEFLRSSSELGLGTPDANVKAGASSETSSGTAREVTIDMSTPGGRATFDDVMIGKPPAADAPGVVDVADLTVFNASKSVDLSMTAGDVSAGGTLAEWGAGGVQRTHADGTTTLDWTGEAQGRQVGGTASFDADGNMVVEDNTYYIRMEGVDPTTAAEYNRNYLGEDVTPTHDQNVVINFTHDDLATMRYQAAATHASIVNANPENFPNFPAAADGHVTSEDVLRYFEEHPDTAGTDLRDIATGDTTMTILGAQSDQEMLRVLMLGDGPLVVQRDLAGDYHTATGNYVRPVGDITSARSA